MAPTALLTLGRLPKALTLARALRAAGYRVLVAEPFRWHVCKPSRAVAASFQVPAPNDSQEGYLATLLDIIEREGVELVVPVSEESLHVAGLAGRLPPGVRLLCPAADQIRSLHDKLGFAERAAALGLSVPETVAADQPAAEALAAAQPFVVKPIEGCSGLGVSLCDAGDSLPPQRGGALVQRRIEGRHISTLALLSAGRSLANVCYEGTVFAGTVAICFQRVDGLRAVEDWVAAFCKGLDYTGFIAFDFIVDEDGIPWAIECNPRVTSGVHFFEPAGLGIALRDPQSTALIGIRSDHDRFQWAYSTLTEAYAAIFRPREFARRLGEMFRARDVIWSLRDPLPFLLMTPMSWEILWPAMTTDITLGEATQRDIAWFSTGEHARSGTAPAERCLSPVGGESGS